MSPVDTLKRGQRHARVMQSRHPGLRHELLLCDDGLLVRSMCLGPRDERLEHHHIVAWDELGDMRTDALMIENLLDRQLRELRMKISIALHPWGVFPPN